jgi:hypothetical protein
MWMGVCIVWVGGGRDGRERMREMREGRWAGIGIVVER